MMTATLSIIIPCYNVEDYVQAALQSILDNTSKKYHNRLQLLIINDGSTDQTWDKIQEWLINLDNLSISYQLINQPNAGLSAARNAGMAQATGNYWLFLDSDDIFINQAIDKIINILDEHAPDIVEFDTTKFTKNTFENQTMYANYFAKIAHLDFTRHRLAAFEENRWYVWTRCYHRKLFENQEFESGKLFEDMMTIPYCYLAATNIFKLPESLIGYRQRTTSILATLSHRHLSDLYWGVEKAIAAEKNYPIFKTELTVLQLKNWRLIVAESIKIFLRTHELAYLRHVQNFRTQMRQKHQRDFGWQLCYFGSIMIKRLLKKPLY
jgi:hypothetical protein